MEKLPLSPLGQNASKQNLWVYSCELNNNLDACYKRQHVSLKTD